MLRSRIRSIIWKYSRFMTRGYAPFSSAGTLGRDQFVDARAEVLQHEILFGGRLAVVDFLRPLFQRQLDPEGLVDGKGDVEEIKAVDAQIVDRMAIRCDRVARDVAGLSDDRGDLIECGGHH